MKKCQSSSLIPPCLFVFQIILKQLFDAAHELQHQRIFHRDIKVADILIETGSNVPRVRIIDFGLSCFFKDKSTYRVFYGKMSSFYSPHCTNLPISDFYIQTKLHLLLLNLTIIIMSVYSRYLFPLPSRVAQQRYLHGWSHRGVADGRGPV